MTLTRQHADPHETALDRDFHTARMAADVLGYTWPVPVARDTLTTLASGTVYGAACRVDRAGTVTHLRVYRASAGSAITEVRVGITDPTTPNSPVWLIVSADLHSDASWGAGPAVCKLPLGGAGVAVKEGQVLVPAIGQLATTSVAQLRGVSLPDAEFASRATLLGQPVGHSKSGWAGGAVLPDLTGHSSTSSPFIELVGVPAEP